MGKRGSALASLLDVQPDAFVTSGGGSYWIDCPKFTQCLPRGYKLEASDSNVGKRQKQAHHQEKPNDGHLKRDGAALIRNERSLWRTSATSTAVCLPLPVADNLGYRSDSNRRLLSNIRPMQIITTIMSITSGVWPLTKHKESISSVMLRNWNTQGSCAEAGLLRKEFGILGLRYAGPVRSPLPVSGIAALRPVSRFLLRSRVGA